MKTYRIITLTAGCVLGLLFSAAAQPSPNTKDDQPAAKASAQAAEQPAPAKEPASPTKDEAAPAPAPAAADQGGAISSDKPASTAKTAEAPQVLPPPTHLVAEGEKGLRMNFRQAPLELVLNYLSDAAGFTIILKPGVDVRGKIDVWSNQALTKGEALQVLNQVLSDNGYAILRKENSLTVVRKDAAMKMDIPVRTGAEPGDIPKDDEIVTQIIPVRFINAPAVAKDLLPLLPDTAEMTSNQDGNAIVITDTQSHIRRMAEIIKALDTAVSSLASVKVFALKYADAKSLATVIKDLFASSQDSGGGGRGGMDPRSRLLSFMGGRGGGMPGGPGGSGSSSGGRPGASRVVATSDERSNSLVVSAPADVMPTIIELVEAVDTDVEEVTELRVFRLQHSDPQEMATVLTSVFPDPTLTSRGSSGGASRFGRFTGGGPGGGGPGGGRPGGGGGPGGGGSSSQSTRSLKEQRVVAVPDYRTASIVVSASHLMMVEVAKTIEQLDADPAKEQKVFVYELKNGDVQNTEEIVRSLFQSVNSRNTSSSQTRSALETREIQSQQYQTSGSGLGNAARSGSRGTSGSTFR